VVKLENAVIVVLCFGCKVIKLQDMNSYLTNILNNLLKGCFLAAKIKQERQKKYPK